MSYEKIMQDTAVERDFPFNDCVVRGEEEAYYQVQRKLHDNGFKSAWIMFSRFQGETRLMLVEGGYTRKYPKSSTTCAALCLCAFAGSLTFSAAFDEKEHGFTTQHYTLPVILRDGTIGKMSRPDGYGYVTISECESETPRIPLHISKMLEYCEGLEAGGVKYERRDSNVSMSVYIAIGDKVMRFSDHFLPAFVGEQLVVS